MTAQSKIAQQDIEELLKGFTIPSPPQVIADLQMEMAMPDPDLNEMANMISKDAGLVGGVLKTINSPFYGQTNVGSISQAVMLLGMNTVMNIVNTLYLRDGLLESGEISDEVMKYMTRFWDAAVDVARSCTIVANRVRYPDVEMTYMLGLIHNAGIPVMMMRYGDYIKVMIESYSCQGIRVVDLENEYFSTNHAVLSYYVARSWKLPVLLCKVIAEHHNCNEVLTSSYIPDDRKLLFAILKLSEHISKTYLSIGNQDVDCEWEAYGNTVIDFLGLSQFDFDDLLGYAEDLGIGQQGGYL